MLIQIFFFILMMMGIAALAVDMGLARLTQSQMQNAADTAALEGLRNASACDSSDLACIDTARQSSADLAQLTFDANGNLDPTDDETGPDPRRVGGSLLQFSGTEINELQGPPLFDPNPIGVYRPILARNSANAPSGDLVRDRLCVQTDPDCPVGIAEGSDYTVGGFIPSTDTAAADNTAFLVRLRRTGIADETNGETSGDTLPLLFARGTFISKGPTGYDPRVAGISVRATAIASGRPALRVGLPQPGRPVGLAPFAVTSLYWNLLINSGTPADILTAGTDGSLVSTGFPTGVVSAGHYLQLPVLPAPQYITVGESSLPLLAPPSSVPAGPAYVPIYDSRTGTVVGFGFVTATLGSLQFTIVASLNHVADQNATALVPGRPALPPGLLSPQNGLLAPVIVR